MRLAGGAPTQRDQARGTVRGAANSVDGREILRQQRVTGDHLDLRTMCVGQRTRGVFQLLRPMSSVGC